MDVCLLGGHVAVEGCGHWSHHTHVHKNRHTCIRTPEARPRQASAVVIVMQR